MSLPPPSLQLQTAYPHQLERILNVKYPSCTGGLLGRKHGHTVLNLAVGGTNACHHLQVVLGTEEGNTRTDDLLRTEADAAPEVANDWRANIAFQMTGSNNLDNDELARITKYFGAGQQYAVRYTILSKLCSYFILVQWAACCR